MKLPSGRRSWLWGRPRERGRLRGQILLATAGLVTLGGLFPEYFLPLLGLGSTEGVMQTLLESETVKSKLKHLQDCAREGAELLRSFDWLKWLLLYCPFWWFYTRIQEKLWQQKYDAFKQEKAVARLEEDNAVKRKFIKWQGKVILGLQEAMADLRVEQRTMRSQLELHRRQSRAELQKTEPAEPPVKKNLSDSAITETMEIKRKDEQPRTIPRPKTEESKPAVQKDRRLERSRERDTLRTKLESIRKEKEDSSDDEAGKERISRNRSKYSLKKELEEYTLPASRLKSRPVVTKKKEEPPQPPAPKTTQIANIESKMGTEELVARLDLKGLGRATSYTEVFRKKVHLTSLGKPPEITIEGKQRWCF